MELNARQIKKYCIIIFIIMLLSNYCYGLSRFIGFANNKIMYDTNYNYVSNIISFIFLNFFAFLISNFFVLIPLIFTFIGSIRKKMYAGILGIISTLSIMGTILINFSNILTIMSVINNTELTDYYFFQPKLFFVILLLLNIILFVSTIILLIKSIKFLSFCSNNSNNN